MASDPFGKERQHPLKVGGFREAVIGTWKNFQPFRSRQGLEESLALVEGHIFIMITLHDYRGNGDGSGRFIRNPVEAVLVENIVEGEASGPSVKIRYRVGLFPFLKAVFSQLQSKLFPEVDHGAFQREAGQWRNGCWLRGVHSCPVSGGENRHETAEAGAYECQPVVSPCEEVVQGGERLADSDGGRQFGEGAIAVAMSEAIEPERGNPPADQEFGQGLVARTVFMGEKPVTQDRDVIGRLFRPGQDGCDTVAERVVEKDRFFHGPDRWHNR